MYLVVPYFPYDPLSSALQESVDTTSELKVQKEFSCN